MLIRQGEGRRDAMLDTSREMSPVAIPEETRLAVEGFGLVL
jgi:hypothetical protein